MSGNPADHGFAVGGDPRPLADHRHVQVDDEPSARRHHVGGTAQEGFGGCVAPLRITGRKMAADVAGTDGTEQGVGERVQAYIGIGMADQAGIEWDCDSAQHHVIAGTEAVHIESEAGADGAPAEEALGAGEVLAGGHLDVVLAARNQRHGQAGPFSDGGVVGEIGASETAVRRQDVGIAERLGRLRPPQAGAVDGGLDYAVATSLQSVADRDRGHRAGNVFQGRQGPRNEVLVDEGADRVVDQDLPGGEPGQALQAEAHRNPGDSPRRGQGPAPSARPPPPRTTAGRRPR